MLQPSKLQQIVRSPLVSDSSLPAISIVTTVDTDEETSKVRGSSFFLRSIDKQHYVNAIIIRLRNT